MTSGVERRRVWSLEQNLAVVAAASVRGRAWPRSRDGLIFERVRSTDGGAICGRRLSRSKRPPPAVVSSDHDCPIAALPALVVELRGAVVKIAADASPTLVTATLRALRR